MYATVLVTLLDGTEFEVEVELGLFTEDALEERIAEICDDEGYDNEVDYMDLLEVEGFYDCEDVVAMFGGVGFEISALVDFAEKVEEHGVAYELRYSDIGDFDFDDQYMGAWDSEGSFAEHLIEDCYDIPEFVSPYIDWDAWARDVMLDYSSYYANSELHIFRD